MCVCVYLLGGQQVSCYRVADSGLLSYSIESLLNFTNRQLSLLTVSYMVRLIGVEHKAAYIYIVENINIASYIEKILNQ